MKTDEMPSDTEIKITRIVEASRERVWRALTDPKELDQWWGPTGFRNVTQTWDFRPGGLWKHVMIGPDGGEYPNATKFVEIVENDHVTYVNAGGKKGEKGISFRMTFSLKALGPSKTEVAIHQVFEKREDRDFVVERFGAIEGGKQTLGKLGEQVTKSGDFVISRVFDAPRERVYRAWTEPERLKDWMSPKGLKTIRCKLDLRPGGFYHYGLATPDGKEMWGKWVFREVVPNERLVFVTSFSDKDMGLTRHPMNAKWPLEMLSTVTFEDKGGKTLLTLVWTAINATEEERKVCDSSHESMKGGWGGTMEQLAAYLKEGK